MRVLGLDDRKNGSMRDFALLGNEFRENLASAAARHSARGDSSDPHVFFRYASPTHFRREFFTSADLAAVTFLPPPLASIMIHLAF